MKKIIILAFLTFFIYSANAQKLSGGLVFAPNLSWFSPNGKTIENQGVHLGYHFGIVGDYNFSKNFAFASGIIVNNLFSSLKFDSAISFHGDKNYTLLKNAIIDYKLKYLEIPLNIKFKTNEIGYITYFLQAGLNPNIRISAKASTKQLGINNEDAKNEISFMYLGYNFGGGILYSLGGNASLLAELIYTNGITDVTVKNYNVNINNLALRIGIIF